MHCTKVTCDVHACICTQHMWPGSTSKDDDVGPAARAYAEAFADCATFSACWVFCRILFKYRGSISLIRCQHRRCSPWPLLRAVTHLAAAPSVDLGKSSGNAFRNADRFVKRWGLRWNIPISTFKYDDPTSIPYISPRALVTWMLKKAPELLLGGCRDVHQGRQHIKAFWQNYKSFHAAHPVYSEHGEWLDSVIPMLLHGDEGRGVRKGNTAVVTLESALGLDSCTSGTYKGCECCAPSAEPVPLCEKQTVNLQYHSYLTKFLLFALPNKVYKETRALQQLLTVVSRELRSLFYEGVQFQGRVWHVGCVGLKGDLQWFKKVAELNRCFLNLGLNNQLCCHECLAGSSTRPFEDVSSTPSWSDSLYVQRPWSEDPSTGILMIPYDAAQPERILRRDFMHTTKLGCFQDFCGSAILLVAHLGYFSIGRGRHGNSRTKILERMHGHFVLYCRAAGKSPRLQGFTKCFLGVPTRKHFGSVNSKASDTMLLLEWLSVLATGCLNRILAQSHRAVLLSLQTAAQHACAWSKSMHRHRLWWKRECAEMMNKSGSRFLKCYNHLALVCLRELKFPAFPMKPKLHMCKHIIYEWEQLLRMTDAPYLPSCLLFACDMNEDMIGRICRVSRRVHQSKLCDRVINAYLIKSYALHKRYLQGALRNKRARTS